MVSIPACHAGDRGSIPRRGDFLNINFAFSPITQVIGRPAKLTCNYVKFRTESVREITWFAGYNGINTKVWFSFVFI